MANLSSVLGGAFDPSTVVATQTEFSVIPKGDYVVTITASEINPTKNGNGQMLALKVTLENNRSIFDNLCIVHSSVVAQNIAQTKLKQITESLGLKRVTDSSQLHDKPLVAHVTVELDKYQTEQKGEKTYRNNISGYSPVSKVAANPVDTSEMSEDVPF
jgi:hypothetical protein